MTKTAPPMFTVSNRRKNHLDKLRVRASFIGINIVQSQENIPLGSNAIYVFHPNCDLDAMGNELEICKKYAKSADLLSPIAFTDWHRSQPELNRMLEFARRGRIASVIFNDVQVFKFCNPRQIGTFLAPLRHMGVSIHFAAESPTNKLLKLPLLIGKSPQSNHEN